MDQEKNIHLTVSPSPQGVLRLLVSLLLGVLVLFLVILAVREMKLFGNRVPAKTISVGGQASVFARPDIGQVNISVFREASTAAAAQEQATTASNKVVEFLKANGVEEKDIKTTNYTVQPVYDYLQDRGRILRGWEVRQGFSVKVRNLDKVGDILAGATENGANDISGLTFTIDEPDELQAQAREEAITDAKERAQKLADNLGVKLGRVVSFSESSGGGYPPPVFYDRAEVGIGGAGPVPSVPSGENEIISNVTIVYEIR